MTTTTFHSIKISPIVSFIMHICVSVTKNTKSKPETSAINANWNCSLYFLIVGSGISVSLRYFVFILVSLVIP